MAEIVGRDLREIMARCALLFLFDFVRRLSRGLFKGAKGCFSQGTQ